MLSRFRRPQPPHTPDFWDQLEHELRRRVREGARKTPTKRRFTARYVRWARSVARPAFHGAMVVVSVVLVAALAQPAPVTSFPSSDPRPGSQRLSAWVPVVEVEDPSPPLVMHAINKRNDRFINFIGSDSIPESVEPVEPVAI